MAFLQVGTIKLSKESKRLYINLNQTKNKEGEYTVSNLKALHKAIGEYLENPEKGGVNLQIEKPADKITRLCELGYIEEEKAQAMIESVPSYIKYEISFVTKD